MILFFETYAKIFETQKNMSEQNFESLKNGDFSKVTDIIIESKDNTEPLITAAKIIAEKINPTNWKENSEQIMDLFIAGFEENSIFKAFDTVFEKVDMLDFSRNVIDTISSAELFSSFPARVIDISLYVTSRVIQNSPKRNEYEYTLGVLNSTLLAFIDKKEFPAMEEEFVRFCKFQPALSNFKIFQTIKDQMINMSNQISISNQTRDGVEKIGRLDFYNKCHLWSNFVFENESFAQAFVQFVVHSMRADRSLKLNPLRLKLSKLLIDHGEFLAPISELAKLLTKSISMKREGDAEFDFDELIVSTKEIGRTEKYQEELFDRGMALLRQALFGLKNRLAFPEISAPVVKAFEMMLANEAFKHRNDEIQQFIQDIKENSTWIEKRREAMVEKTTGFNITQVLNIDGDAPFEE